MDSAQMVTTSRTLVLGSIPRLRPTLSITRGNKVTLNVKTLDMTAVHYGGVLEYNAHNLFGEATEKMQCQILNAN